MTQKVRKVCIERDMVKTQAWLSLNASQMKVYLIFCCKRVYESYQGKKHRKREPTLVNNGEIVFTYDEAEEKYGISESTFKRAIDGLIKKGFLDIARTGCGTHKSTTYYAMSERWRKYGTVDFVKWKGPKRSRGYPGFKPGNTYGKKKKSTVTYDCGATVKNDGGALIAMFTNDRGERVKKLYKFSGHNWIDVKIA